MAWTSPPERAELDGDVLEVVTREKSDFWQVTSEPVDQAGSRCVRRKALEASTSCLCGHRGDVPGAFTLVGPGELQPSMVHFVSRMSGGAPSAWRSSSSFWPV